jgi:hypothetical protein
MSDQKKPEELIDMKVKQVCEELNVTPDELNKLFDSQSVPEFIENLDKVHEKKEKKTP